MANLQSLIKQHNAKVLTDGKKPTRLCNCRYKDSCPLAGKCLAKCIVYKAEVTTKLCGINVYIYIYYILYIFIYIYIYY